MSHARTQIRNAAGAILTGLATTGANVFVNRRRPVGNANLPCLLVYCDDEPNIEKMTAGKPKRLQRDLKLIVKGLVKSGDALEDTLDDIAKEVEVAIAADLTLGGLVKLGVWLDSIETDETDELEKPAGVIVMTFSAIYSTNSNAPEIAL